MARKRGKKKKSPGGKGELPNPSANAQTYHGPIVSRNMREAEELVSIPLIFTGTVSSTAGAVIDAYYSSDPASYGLTDWTNLSGLYGECRTLGLRVEFYPNNRYSKTTVNCTPLMVLVDRDTPTAALGSYQTAASHESARVLSLEDPWKEEARMQNAEESQFQSVSGTTPFYSIKFYADSLSVSTTYGRMFVHLVIQFRGRK